MSAWPHIWLGTGHSQKNWCWEGLHLLTPWWLVREPYGCVKPGQMSLSPGPQSLQQRQEVRWDRAGRSCCSPTGTPAQLPQSLYLKAHCGFLFLTVLQLLKLLPSISALAPARCHPPHSSPGSWLSSAQAPASLVPTVLPLPSAAQPVLSSCRSSHNFPVKGPAGVPARANGTSRTQPRTAVGLAV